MTVANKQRERKNKLYNMRNKRMKERVKEKTMNNKANSGAA